MAKVKFTAGRVDAFECDEGKSQSFLWDAAAPGLGLRATANGAKAYMFQAKLNGAAIRVTIGAPETWSIQDAQAEARRLKVMIDNGQDPRQVKADAIAADAARLAVAVSEAKERHAQERRDSVTLGMVWPIYVASRSDRWSAWHIRDHENVVRLGGQPKKRGKGLTEAGPLASLLAVRLVDLAGKRIGEWLALEAKARATQAALSFRLLSVFVNWCESTEEYAGLVPAGACKARQVRDEMPSKNAKENDSLQREQLAPWFSAVRGMSNLVQSAYLQALLLTGARRRELSALEWSDVDFQWQRLTIRDKVEGERTIPLTPYVAGLLAGLPRCNGWVFASPASASGQLTEPTPGHKRALAAAGLPDMTLHGLRRSFGTLAEWTEAPTGVVAQIMGHKPSAIAEKHYRQRPIDLLRMWHIKIEEWMLLQAGLVPAVEDDAAPELAAAA
ncbi:tyrosine-type recombinase/integrase [Duganella violaceipulchra]|uniref:Integrase n=1 Tax=Duganella violaceipulchra TaxID=2849652 RepID=A0AA41L1J3_9BURK|nr:integrase family protein [Duganella violaceicalia]MBV6324911.1 integrase family protein [Duganella violaceicalia]MCP2012341.1 integrase [Duganella violaceicalia]